MEIKDMVQEHTTGRTINMKMKKEIGTIVRAQKEKYLIKKKSQNNNIHVILIKKKKKQLAP